MANEVATTGSFQERVINKLRDDIGSLMTDEELQKLVKEAADRLFFRPEKVEGNYSNGYRDTLRETEFVKICREHLAPQVKAAALEYMQANPAIIEEVVRKVVAEGFMGVFTTYMQQVSASGITALVQAFKQNGLLDPNKFYPGIS